jgi:hypothetical protein
MCYLLRLLHLLLLLLLRWHYSPMRTLMGFSYSVLFFDLSFQFLILHLLVPVCTHFHHQFFGRHFLHHRTII